MPGYLDQYGAGEERRNRIIARSIIAAVLVVLAVALGWYLLENHHQEGVVKAFLNDIRRGDYQSGYREWGCTSPKACPGYSFNNFMEDWGSSGAAGQPKTSAPDPSVVRLTDSESCNNGVLLTVAVNRAREEKLWVDKSSDLITFAPYPVCPHKNPFAIMIHRTVGRLRKPLLR